MTIPPYAQDILIVALFGAGVFYGYYRGVFAALSLVLKITLVLLVTEITITLGAHWVVVAVAYIALFIAIKLVDFLFGLVAAPLFGKEGADGSSLLGRLSRLFGALLMLVFLYLALVLAANRSHFVREHLADSKLSPIFLYGKEKLTPSGEAVLRGVNDKAEQQRDELMEHLQKEKSNLKEGL